MLTVAEKKMLTLDDIEAQTALELPERETPVTVIIGCLALCVGQIVLRNITVDVAATVCAQIQAITVNNAQLLSCRTVAG
jgi:Mg/Co/Ni transporter MgtE